MLAVRCPLMLRDTDCGVPPRVMSRTPGLPSLPWFAPGQLRTAVDTGRLGGFVFLFWDGCNLSPTVLQRVLDNLVDVSPVEFQRSTGFRGSAGVLASMTSCAVGVPASASSVATVLGEHAAMTSFSSSSFLRWVGRELLFLRLDPRPNPVPNAGIGAFLRNLSSRIISTGLRSALSLPVRAWLPVNDSVHIARQGIFGQLCSTWITQFAPQSSHSLKKRAEPVVEFGLIGEDLKHSETSSREGPNDDLASLTHDHLPTVATIQLGGFRYLYTSIHPA
jgi:hypothetical protein